MPQLPPPPPPNPVVYHQPANNTYDSTSANDLKAEANGENTNIIDTKGSLSAVQVNNFNNGELYIETVGRRPIGNINVNTFATSSGEVAISLTYSTPIGGRSAKQFDLLAQKRIQREEARYATDLINTCTSLQKNNVVVANFADPAVISYMQKCKGISFLYPIIPAKPEQDDLLIRLEKLEQENEALKNRLIQHNTNLEGKRG